MTQASGIILAFESTLMKKILVFYLKQIHGFLQGLVPIMKQKIIN
jgi:hypothetical protein